MAVEHITTQTFQRMVLGQTQPVLLDFWAPWCGPCRALGPIIEEVAQECPDVLVGKINVDEEPELAKNFRVMSIPMVLVLRDGVIVSRSVGTRSKVQILEMLEKGRRAT